MNYFRITGYCEKEDYCFILDSNGAFDELWKFSSHLLHHGLEVLEVSKAENMIDVNITKAEQDNENVILRANANGKPKYITQMIDGISYKAIKVANKIYIPDKTQTI